MRHSEQKPITPAQRALLDLLSNPAAAAEYFEHLCITLDLSIAGYTNPDPTDDPAVLTRLTADAWRGQLEVMQAIVHLAVERPQNQKQQ